jgi:hypothetical protein
MNRCFSSSQIYSKTKLTRVIEILYNIPNPSVFDHIDSIQVERVHICNLEILDEIAWS